MIQRLLNQQLNRVVRRVRHVRLWTVLALNWLLFTLLAAGLFATMGNIDQPWTVKAALVAAALISALVLALAAWRSAGDLHSIARRIEACFPSLNSGLLAAIEQQPEPGSPRLGYLQETVVQRALSHARRYPWGRVVSTGRLIAAQAFHAIALGLFLIVVAGWFTRGVPLTTDADAAPELAAGDAADRYQFSVEPGDAQIERGTSLLVLARFTGTLPGEAALVYHPANGEPARASMARSLDDPLFGGRVAGVTQDLSYRVELPGQSSSTYRITVFEYPRLEQADAHLEFPQYTSQDAAVVEDTRQVTAVEGTRLTWVCRLNKPVRTARLQGRSDEEIELSPRGDDRRIVAATITLKKSQRYRLHLVDAAGRANQEPPELVVNVTPNRPAELKLAWPTRDVQVSPLEELKLQASVWDDFGLASFGVSYSQDGAPPKEIVLGKVAAAKKPRELVHQLNFEELDAEPDQLVAYHFWAEDVDTQGKLRRTSSDMFFAEVRPFEEIFRQGQQPPGGASQQQQQGAGGNAQKADELAKLQKQIVVATWKLVRREVGSQPTEKFLPDARLLVESQQSALEQAQELTEKISDARSKKYLASALEHMMTAAGQLGEAADGADPSALEPALPAEQAAYAALLRLRAREHRVVQGQPQQGSGSSSAASRSSQQLKQLELKNEQNRYETQRTASPQADQEQREDRQVLNRLRELAQRQEDLNRRLQELQSALEAAKSEAEREEIRRQLKRLRDQQQQQLRDTDELSSRMDQPENQRRMADAKQQLDETRSNVRQASEALERGQVSRALTSGTRANRELKELRDQFRKKAAGRFSEEMQQMREQARELDQRQQALSESLTSLDQQRGKSLRDGGGRQPLEEKLGEQKSSLSNLENEMQQVIQAAEHTEPLLSKQLYDTLRKAKHQRLDDALEMTRQLLQRGLLPQAAEPDRQASEGIRQLRQGVERAARSVLGDEAEALRRAQQELEQLANEIGQEVAQADPTGNSQPATKSGGENRPTPANQAAAKPPGDAGQPGGKPNSEKPGAEAKPASGGQGKTPASQGKQPGEKPGSPKQQGNSSSEQSKSPAQSGQPGGKPSTEQSQSSQSQQGQPQQGQSQQGQSSSPSNAQNAGSQNGQEQQSSSSQSLRGESSASGPGRFERMFEAGNGPVGRPLTGAGFREWSDRMRDVEEMIDDAKLRAEVARVRDRARGMRREWKRHSKEPNWDLVRRTIVAPLAELQREIADELLRRQSKEALVPIDRDPVPPRFSEPVRRYYERLGRGG